MANNVEVQEHVHEPPKYIPIPGPWVVLPGGGLVTIVLGGVVYGIRVGGDGLIQLVSPDAKFGLAAKFCTYYSFATALPHGKRARLRISDNEQVAPNHGGIDIFVTPDGAPRPPAGNPTPRTMFGGNGETTVNGPGIVTIHLRTNTPPAKVEVWFEDIP